MKQLIVILGWITLALLTIWVLTDDSWRLIWGLNKEIIQTNIIKWVPVMLLWSPIDNMMDHLWFKYVKKKKDV
jgi:hypothetical protein